MGAGRLQGTPWHHEYLKKDDTDPKHDKRSCEYFLGNNECYINGRCNGGRYCTKFELRQEKTKNQLEYRARDIEDDRNYENLIVTYQYKFIGVFTVKFLDDNEIVKYAIGKNKNELEVLGATKIKKNTPLFRKVLVTEPNNEFEVNGTRVLLIKKKIEKYIK